MWYGGGSSGSRIKPLPYFNEERESGRCCFACICNSRELIRAVAVWLPLMPLLLLLLLPPGASQHGAPRAAILIKPPLQPYGSNVASCVCRCAAEAHQGSAKWSCACESGFRIMPPRLPIFLHSLLILCYEALKYILYYSRYYWCLAAVVYTVVFPFVSAISDNEFTTRGSR